MLVTRCNQTPLELATEFINVISGVQSGSKDMDALFEWFIHQEKLPVCPDSIMNQVTSVNRTEFNALEVPFIRNCHPNVSYVLLAWIASQSSGIPDSVNTLLGLICTYFYSTHNRKEQVTLEWLGNTIGKGKLMSFKEIFLWFSASKNNEGESVFNLMTSDDLFMVK